MYSVACQNLGVLDHVSPFASRRQILVVPFCDRPRSCGDHAHECVSVRRTPAQRQLPAEATGTPVQLPEPQCLRLSFCCDRDGCRKRVTPPSVRFLGRMVYLGAVVIVISAMRQGPSPRRVRELSARFGADRRTIARWQVFWREHFPPISAWGKIINHFTVVGTIGRRRSWSGRRAIAREVSRDPRPPHEESDCGCDVRG